MRLYDVQLLSGTSFRWELGYFQIPTPTNAYEERRARRHIERFYQRYVAWGNPNGYVEPIVDGYNIDEVMRELGPLVLRFEQRRLPTWTTDQYCTHLLSVYWRLVRFMRYPAVDLEMWIDLMERTHDLVERWIATHNPYGVHNFMRKPEKYWLSRDHVWLDVLRRADIQRQERARLYRLERQIQRIEPQAIVPMAGMGEPRREAEENDNVVGAAVADEAAALAVDYHEPGAATSPYRPAEEVDDSAEQLDAESTTIQGVAAGALGCSDEQLHHRCVGVSVEMEEDALLLSSASSVSSGTAAKRELFVYLSSELNTSQESVAASMFLGFALEQLANSCAGSAECDCRRCWLRKVRRQAQGSESGAESPSVCEIIDATEEVPSQAGPRSSAEEAPAEWPQDIPPLGIVDIGTERDVATAMWGRLVAWVDALPVSSAGGDDSLEAASDWTSEGVADDWQVMPFMPFAREAW
jgi:hypothetical protein